jgi:hypothetical protein
LDERDPALEPFDALIGTWATEATHQLVDAVVPGSITFEWLEGGHFLVQRSRNDHESFPDAISVIGAAEAGEGLVMETPGDWQDDLKVTYRRRDQGSTGCHAAITPPRPP